jgi:hypothetical protein
MKLNKLAVPLLALGLLGSSAAFARESNQTTLHLREKINVNGKVLNPGRYTVDWQGSGPAVQVDILRGKETVATAPAHLAEQPTRNDSDAYAFSTRPDGTRTLTTIYVGGERTTLQFNQTQAASSSSSAR